MERECLTLQPWRKTILDWAFNEVTFPAGKMAVAFEVFDEEIKKLFTKSSSESVRNNIFDISLLCLYYKS